MRTTINLDTLTRNFLNFKRSFQGEIYYAIKANNSNYILNTLHQLGIDGFDVASTLEMNIVRETTGNSRLHLHASN
jgi:ornithine decarboxylase